MLVWRLIPSDEGRALEPCDMRREDLRSRAFSPHSLREGSKHSGTLTHCCHTFGMGLDLVAQEILPSVVGTGSIVSTLFLAVRLLE